MTSKKKKSSNKKLKAAVYKSGNGQFTVVFNQKILDKKAFRCYSGGKMSLLPISTLVVLHNRHLLEKQRVSKDRLDEHYKDVLDKVYNSKEGVETAELDFDFVPKMVGLRRTNSMIRQMSNLIEATKAGRNCIFDPDEKSVMRKKGKDSYLEFPSAVVDERGAVFKGLSQIAALQQCEALGVKKQQGNLYILSHRRPPVKMHGVLIPTYDKAKGRVNEYTFYPCAPSMPSRTQKSRKKQIENLVSKGKSSGNIRVSAVEPNISVEKFIALRLAAGKIGIPFETTDAIRAQKKAEFLQRSQMMLDNGEYDTFYKTYNDSIERKSLEIVKDLRRDISRIYSPNIERTRDRKRSSVSYS